MFELKAARVYCTRKGVFYDYITTAEDAIYLLNKLSQFSIYTMEEELKRGYVTLRGGIESG